MGDELAATGNQRDAASGPPESPSPAPYPTPPNLSSPAKDELDDQVRRFVSDIVAELDRQEYRARDQGWKVLHTEQSVRAAAEVVRRAPLINDSVADDTQRAAVEAATTLSTIGAILMAIATVGVPTIAPFLNSILQIVLFVLFVASGVAGLIVTWIAHKRSRRIRRGGGSGSST